jgi:hypothetical protein
MERDNAEREERREAAAQQQQMNMMMMMMNMMMMMMMAMVSAINPVAASSMNIPMHSLGNSGHFLCCCQFFTILHEAIILVVLVGWLSGR